MPALISNNLLIIITVLLVATLIALVIRLEIKINNLLGGTDSKNIQEGMEVIRSELKAMQTFSEKATAHFFNIEKRLRKSVQHIDTIRFNPFKGTGAGGNQSFSTSFLDEHGDGVVISSLHARERISVFSKPIKAYGSEYELSNEEKEVIKRAKTGAQETTL